MNKGLILLGLFTWFYACCTCACAGATVGGVTPLIITAIQASTGAVFLGPGVFMTFMALTSVLGSLALIKHYPATNTVP
jgi:hypothetical protein